MPSLIEDRIQITILFDSQAEQCDPECGLDWSSPGSVALVNQGVQDRFGTRVKAEYVDLAKTESSQEAEKWRQAVREINLPLPLLLINGQPRISGQFDVRRLIDTVEAEMEMRA